MSLQLERMLNYYFYSENSYITILNYISIRNGVDLHHLLKYTALYSQRFQMMNRFKILALTCLVIFKRPAPLTCWKCQMLICFGDQFLKQTFFKSQI